MTGHARLPVDDINGVIDDIRHIVLILSKLSRHIKYFLRGTAFRSDCKQLDRA